MTLDILLELILAVLFFAYIVRRDLKNNKTVPFKKSLLHRTKKSKNKFILSCRDYSKLENDHTDEYIQSCWDEIEKHKK